MRGRPEHEKGVEIYDGYGQTETVNVVANLPGNEIRPGSMGLPFEVESALLEHEAVVEAAVVGMPDPDRGQIVKAFVILAEGRAGSDELASELQDHVKGTTAPYKYPREIEFVAELPKTVSGKIRRVELRGQASGDS